MTDLATGVAAPPATRRFDQREIAIILPHKLPFLLLDSVHDIQPGLEGKGVRRVRAEDWFFNGHFPDNPIMPGVVIVEALAQLSAVVYVTEFLKDELGACAGRIGYLARVDMKFHSPVRPPAVLDLHARMVRKIGSLFRFQVKACVGSTIVADGTINVSENPTEE